MAASLASHEKVDNVALRRCLPAQQALWGVAGPRFL